MANNIYDYLKENFNIETDYIFKRDYIKNPLYIAKNGRGSEVPNKEDIEYLSSILNQKDMAKVFNISLPTLQRCVKTFGIITSKENILDKIKQTKLEKYGNENYNNRKKYEKTIKEKYGSKQYFQSNDFKKKSKQTKLERYGDENYFDKEKFKKSNLEKYGKEYYTQTDIYKEKYKQTCLEKYGVKHYRQSNEYKEKVKQTNIEKYGKDFSSQKNYTNETYNLLTNKELLEQYIKNNNILNGLDLSKHLNIGDCTANRYLKKYHLHNMFDYSKSIAEKEIREYINQYYKSINNSRDIIPPYELDIYIPELNKAIEYNGDYWHNLSEIIKNKDLIKQTICKNNGIDLLVIWEHDYNDNKEDVYKRIDTFLNINHQKD